MTSCAICQQPLPEHDDQTDQMNERQEHFWSEHGELWNELLTGDLSEESFAKLQRVFLTSQAERIAEVAEDAP